VHIRQHPSTDDERRVWLSSNERRRLISATDSPEREVAVRLGLHGLRAKEILAVQPDDIHPIDGSDELRWLQVDAKDTDRDRRRDAPLRRDLAQALRFGGGSIDVTTTKTLRRWVEAAANSVRDETGDDRWRWLTPHDLRRTWATGLFYRLAAAGVPVAEELVMSWGGWKQTASGRETFRERYLGPVPDSVTVDALERTGWLA